MFVVLLGAHSATLVAEGPAAHRLKPLVAALARDLKIRQRTAAYKKGAGYCPPLPLTLNT